MAPNRGRLDRMAERRASVLTRAELLNQGASTDWISRRVSSGRWQRVYPGVYVVHTGSLGWRTRMVAALRYAGPGAALSHHSAASFWFEKTEAARLSATGPIEVSVPWKRRVRRQAGLRIHRRRTMPQVQPGLVAVTLRVDTALDLVDRASTPDDVVGVLTRACRHEQPILILRGAAQRPRLHHRELVTDVLADVETGVESPLEYRYHRDVEAAHGLPRAELQLREKLSGRWVRADCRYRAYQVRVELDGQLAHPGGRTDQDTWRDNAALLQTREITLRYRWRHIAQTPCETASQVAQALRRGGWTGTPTPCRAGCPAAPPAA